MQKLAVQLVVDVGCATGSGEELKQLRAALKFLLYHLVMAQHDDFVVTMQEADISLHAFLDGWDAARGKHTIDEEYEDGIDIALQEIKLQ